MIWVHWVHLGGRLTVPVDTGDEEAGQERGNGRRSAGWAYPSRRLYRDEDNGNEGCDWC